MAEYGIPQDAQWGDIDIMDRQLGNSQNKGHRINTMSFLSRMSRKSENFCINEIFVIFQISQSTQ